MVAAIEASGPPYRKCAICGLEIGEGQWEVHGRGDRVYHHACWSHGTAQPIEIPDREGGR